MDGCISSISGANRPQAMNGSKVFVISSSMETTRMGRRSRTNPQRYRPLPGSTAT